MAKVKKKRLRVGRLIIFLVVVFLMLYLVFSLFKFLINKIIVKTADGYVSSITETVKLYNLDFVEDIDIVRGSKVIIYEKEIENEDEIYKKIKYDKEIYLIDSDNLSYEYEDSVKEEKMYVRTPITIYENNTSSDITSMAKNGEELEVVGFDKLNTDGTVNMYKVKKDDIEGYVYSKYLVKNQEEANKNYDENGIYLTHGARTNRLGGGDGASLDYYPVEKPKFEDNVMPEEARTLYLNSGVLGNLDEYITLAKNSNINAFVVDIKDNTAPGYASPVMQELSPTNYERAINSFDTYESAIKKLKDEGFYVIGRITVFKDSYYVADNPGCAITSTSTGNPYSHNGSYWPSAYSRDVWEFNVKLAIEAVKEMGFNEIQFDYTRFPDKTNTIEQQGLVDMKNVYNETKAQAIQGFLIS